MKVSWSQFKSFRNARGTDILMLQDSAYYELFTSENGFTARCTIDKNPSDTTELDDFEDNYLSLCNPKKVDRVTPTLPSNDTEMKPYGLVHKHIDASSGCIYDITLTNKSGKNYNYTCSETPQEHDAVVNATTEENDEIEDVDTENGVITTFSGNISNGARKLIKPVRIEFKFPDCHNMYKYFGAYVAVEDFGDDDWVCGLIIDKENKLGYGADFVLKEYDEKWCKSLHKTTGPIMSLSGSAGDVPSELWGVFLYYPTDPTKTDIKIWIDPEIEV